jgi:hypothetical protein
VSAALALLVPFITVIVTGMIPLVSYIKDRDSHTRFKVTSSGNNEIYLKAWNMGRKPSTLLEYRLRFDEMPAKESMLELNAIDKKDVVNVIAPGTPARIRLSLALPATIPERRRKAQYTPEERMAMLLRKSPMTMEIDVEESSDSNSSFHRRTDKFPTDRISDFIREQWWSKYGQ